MIRRERLQAFSPSSVLIVEPHADLRAGIVSTLQRRNYVCDAVATPEAAALMLREHDYAFVVVDLDVDAPTCELVSSVPAAANVILLTADVASDNEFRVLRKPFSGDELLAQLVRR